MMVRQTSLEAFKDIADSGNITKGQLKVWQTLRHYGPRTGAELDVMLDSPSAHKRLSELVRLGIAKEKRVRSCTVTGREVIEYEYIDTPPLRQRGTAITRPSPAMLIDAISQIRLAYVGKQMPASVEALVLWVDRKLVKTANRQVSAATAKK